MTKPELVLCTPVRTPIGAYGGALKDTPASELGAAVVREVLRRSSLPADKIDTVVMGNVIQAGGRMNPARQTAIGGGLPVQVPALTVNRVCGSGAQAIVTGALEILVGDAKMAIVGGMENMDRAPYLAPGGRWGNRMGDAVMLDSMLSDGLNDAFSGQHSGWHTEDLVAKYAITREDQDRWAARSQQRFGEAQTAGKFDAEITGIQLNTRKGIFLFDRDEANRPDTTVETLAKLRPAFREDGTITAGNAPGINAGASALIVAEREYAESQGLQPWARLVAHGVVAVDPGMFGLGPIPAVKLVLERARWRQSDIERIEINEAFAAVTLACLRELGLPEDIVNVEGGSIAHGHAIGATGAVLTTRLLHSMRRDGIRRGVVTLCIGGGQGIALALEVV
ncbi:thiolase family protein [Achromobacter mucicolens]|uniref:thiolase family protein n=1 Tax=Achromobacter mucicolens TaxID=1389922 RepID=UPI002447DC39|nr:thiolase family protein [Achromobacter mucicolens]MDH0090481.1 thiolase family protein [Achromobacter mucicolens]